MNSGINFGCWNKKLIKLIIENRTSKYDGNSSQIQIWILVPFPTKNHFQDQLGRNQNQEIPQQHLLQQNSGKKHCINDYPSFSLFLSPSSSHLAKPDNVFPTHLHLLYAPSNNFFSQVRACLGPYKSYGKITYLALSNFLTVIQLLLKNQYEKILKL